MTTIILTSDYIKFDTTGLSTVNIKSVKWKINHTVTPRTLPSSKVPVGWLQGHSFVEGELSIIGENSGIKGYCPGSSDSTILTTATITIKDINNANVVYTFSNLIFISSSNSVDFNTGEPITTYVFYAYSVS